MYEILFNNDMINIKSEINRELESVIIDKNTEKTFVKFKSDNEEKQFNEVGNYYIKPLNIEPLNEDKNFKINIIKK